MELNITLVLQAVQFACSYFFLYRFVFAPASKILDANDRAEKELQKGLEHDKQLKLDLLKKCHEKKVAGKKQLLDAIPQESIQSMCQKSEFGSTLYEIKKIECQKESMEEAEQFLVEHLSRVVKK